MKLKSKIVASAVLAAIVCGVSAVQAATSITLNVVYVGSTTGTTTNTATRIAGAAGTTNGYSVNATNFPQGSISNASAYMSQYTPTQLGTADVQGIVGLKNYYAVYIDYVPNAPTDRLYGVGFDVTYPAGMTPVTGSGLADSGTQKMILWNPVDLNTNAQTWDQFGDVGTNNGDLAGNIFFQATAANAMAMNIGTADANTTLDDNRDYVDAAGYVSGKGTLLGLFALAFTQTSGVSGTVSVASSDCRWWTSSTTTEKDVSALHFNGAAILGSTPDIPEPASLGVLALGGLALLARRRK